MLELEILASDVYLIRSMNAQFHDACNKSTSYLLRTLPSLPSHHSSDTATPLFIISKFGLNIFYNQHGVLRSRAQRP